MIGRLSGGTKRDKGEREGEKLRRREGREGVRGMGGGGSPSMQSVKHAICSTDIPDKMECIFFFSEYVLEKNVYFFLFFMDVRRLFHVWFTQ